MKIRSLYILMCNWSLFAVLKTQGNVDTFYWFWLLIIINRKYYQYEFNSKQPYFYRRLHTAFFTYLSTFRIIVIVLYLF
jgi:hypothetical protein